MSDTARNYRASGPNEVNRHILNGVSHAYSCALHLDELGLCLTGRMEIDNGAPVLWIAPPAEPETLFGRYAVVLEHHQPQPRRYGSVFLKECHVRWPMGWRR